MESNQQGFESFLLFSSLDEKTQSGLLFLDSSEKPLPHPTPPCLEVLPCQVPSSVKPALEPVNLDGLILLKGRVSTQKVFSLSSSDLVPGKYEDPFNVDTAMCSSLSLALAQVRLIFEHFRQGTLIVEWGLKLWEGSLDLVKTLRSEVETGNLSLAGKRVLELGCGHGLPGIFACLKGAVVVHFQDFNSEVLECLTIPNVNANIPAKSKSLTADATSLDTDTDIRFFAGDWSEVHQILPHVTDEQESHCSSGLNQSVGYDIILMAETVYSVSTLPILYELIKKCMSQPDGVVYMAAKKYYFGVGGGSRRFISVVEKDGVMVASLIAEVGGGSSNVREVWKLQLK